ncbi:MAG: hypothetical protein E4H01_07875 [Lysobacterales bacterium]|nr:MAG: hypothetical protein E4H01_07875 [Xanthomonadales bacterium]
MALLTTEREYAATLSAELGSINAENVMKRASVQPQRGVYSFDAADALVDSRRDEQHGCAWPHADLGPPAHRQHGRLGLGDYRSRRAARRDDRSHSIRASPSARGERAYLRCASQCADWRALSCV